jgi:hypothetical protein
MSPVRLENPTGGLEEALNSSTHTLPQKRILSNPRLLQPYNGWYVYLAIALVLYLGGNLVKNVDPLGIWTDNVK